MAQNTIDIQLLVDAVNGLRKLQEIENTANKLDKKTININVNDKGLRNTSSLLSSINKGVDLFYPALKKVAAGVSLVGGSILTAGLNTAKAQEQALFGLETILGSQEKAAATFAKIEQVSLQTPFEISDLTKFTQMVSVFTKDGEKAVDVVTALGGALLASGKDIGLLNNIVANYGDLASGGFTNRDWREFQRNIPIVTQMLGELGITSAETFKKYAESVGEAPADILFELAQRFVETSDVYGKYAQTVVGQEARLRKTFKQQARDLVENTGFYELYADTLGKVSDTMPSIFDKLAKAFTPFIEQLKNIDFGNIINQIADFMINFSTVVGNAIASVGKVIGGFVNLFGGAGNFGRIAGYIFSFSFLFKKFYKVASLFKGLKIGNLFGDLFGKGKKGTVEVEGNFLGKLGDTLINFIKIAGYLGAVVLAGRAFKDFEENMPELNASFWSKLANAGLAYSAISAFSIILGKATKNFKSDALVGAGSIIVSTVLITQVAHAMKTLDEEVPEISLGFISKLGNMGIALASFSALAIGIGEIVTRLPVQSIAGGASILALSAIIKDVASALKIVDESVPTLSGDLVSKIGSMAVALGAFTLLVEGIGLLIVGTGGLAAIIGGAGALAIVGISATIKELASALDAISEVAPKLNRINDVNTSKISNLLTSINDLGKEISSGDNKLKKKDVKNFTMFADAVNELEKVYNALENIDNSNLNNRRITNNLTTIKRAIEEIAGADISKNDYKKFKKFEEIQKGIDIISDIAIKISSKDFKIDNKKVVTQMEEFNKMIDILSDANPNNVDYDEKFDGFDKVNTALNTLIEVSAKIADKNFDYGAESAKKIQTFIEDFKGLSDTLSDYPSMTKLFGGNKFEGYDLISGAIQNLFDVAELAQKFEKDILVEDSSANNIKESVRRIKEIAEQLSDFPEMTKGLLNDRNVFGGYGEMLESLNGLVEFIKSIQALDFEGVLGYWQGDDGKWIDSPMEHIKNIVEELTTFPELRNNGKKVFEKGLYEEMKVGLTALVEFIQYMQELIGSGKLKFENLTGHDGAFGQLQQIVQILSEFTKLKVSGDIQIFDGYDEMVGSLTSLVNFIEELDGKNLNKLNELFKGGNLVEGSWLDNLRNFISTISQIGGEDGSKFDPQVFTDLSTATEELKTAMGNIRSAVENPIDPALITAAVDSVNNILSGFNDMNFESTINNIISIGDSVDLLFELMADLGQQAYDIGVLWSSQLVAGFQSKINLIYELVVKLISKIAGLSGRFTQIGSSFGSALSAGFGNAISGMYQQALSVVGQINSAFQNIQSPTITVNTRLNDTTGLVGSGRTPVGNVGERSFNPFSSNDFGDIPSVAHTMSNTMYGGNTYNNTVNNNRNYQVEIKQNNQFNRSVYKPTNRLNNKLRGI